MPSTAWNFPLLTAFLTRVETFLSRRHVPTTLAEVQASLVEPDGTLAQAATYVVGQDMRIETIVSGITPTGVQAFVDGAAVSSVPWTSGSTSQTIDLGVASVAEVGAHTAYTVVTLNDGTTKQSNNVIITVTQLPTVGQLAGTISASATSGAAPLAVYFTSTVSGGLTPYSHLWDFGDGSPPSTAANPSHTYQSAGSYSVTDRLTDAAGNSITLGPISITTVGLVLFTATLRVLNGAAPVADASIHAVFDTSYSAAVTQLPVLEPADVRGMTDASGSLSVQIRKDVQGIVSSPSDVNPSIINSIPFSPWYLVDLSVPVQIDVRDPKTDTDYIYPAGTVFRFRWTPTAGTTTVELRQTDALSPPSQVV